MPTAGKLCEFVQAAFQKRFIYGEYLQIVELNAADAPESADPVLRKTYQWGPLEPVATRILAMSVFDETGTYVEDLYYTHDALKNTMALFGIKAGRRALYEYGPYGNVLKMEGNAAEINPFRFSSEYFDEETGLVQYNFRYYNPKDGRWISRDPLAIGLNLYSFLNNEATQSIDLYGLISDNFTDEAKKFIKENCKCFNTIGSNTLKMEFIDIISAAMAIAEELSTRTGFKKLVDDWQDWKSQHGWPMFVFTDIGKGNINENTAKAVDLSPLDYNPDFKKALNDTLQSTDSRRKFLVTDEGTIMVGLLEMQSMSKKTAPYIPKDMEQYKKAQVNVNAWREGDGILERMKKGKENKEPYEPSPGNDLEQYKANYEKIKEILESCK